jgi:uncharacterized protein YbbC (DUF1343 family)/CubicO group peptidase (beta-lactamase class C family)
MPDESSNKLVARLQSALAQAVRDSKGPGAVGLVGTDGEIVFLAAAGNAQSQPSRRTAATDTIYDLASLTKVVATTTAILKLNETKTLDLDQPAGEWIPIPAFMQFTIRQLLNHTAGLTAGEPLYRKHKSLDAMIQHYATLPLSNPPGARYRYSDVGFMLLGKIVELAGRDSLDAFCAREIFRPLEMTDTFFNPPESLKSRIAATEKCRWRGRVIHGEVHDENAYAVGGVSGHAGLFSTASDLGRFCRALLSGKLFSDETFAAMTQRGQVPYWPWQGLGWVLDPWLSSSQGYLPARTAIGHTGWTGTCMWMDRTSGVYSVLLGNTCHPSRRNRNNEEFRRTFYTAVAKDVLPSQTNTHVGLDRLVHERFEGLRGKRIALLTNHAAQDSLGRHILDVFALTKDVKLTMLYSPEHGLRGQAEAGAAVSSEGGRIPIVSLYGDRKEPTADELAKVDMFVVDLPDVGARYYTYAATMKACMKACEAAGKPFVVLDRPNPVGGEVLEGPIAEAGGSLVRYARIPIRHGMTLGELAVFFRKTEFTSSRFSVLVKTLENWERHRLYDECQLQWTPPSPNLPTAQTALAYVGMCLFEGTNLNEGRGTDTPFLVAGAPWLHAKRIAEAVDPADRVGINLEVVEYTPRSMPGKAVNPRFKDERCQGVALRIDDPKEARPFRLAIALLSAIRKEHKRKLEWLPFFDTLAGTSNLRKQIEAGESATSIVAGYESALTKFDSTRPKRYT